VAKDDLDAFEWDDVKSKRNEALRGLDFEFASRVFDGSFFEREDRRHDYGELRFLTTGEVDGFVITVVWTPRSRARRIISAWPASRQERRMYRGYREKE
jgi:uncharacterized DUF497 family protein